MLIIWQLFRLCSTSVLVTPISVTFCVASTYILLFSISSFLRHIYLGTENVAADALTRGNYSLFHFLQPQVHEQVIPLLLVTLFLSYIPDWNCPAWTAQFRLSL